ncbi:MAG: S-methyl-5-thioribose-1-phosphate isomerase [Myxococcota bacterium]
MRIGGRHYRSIWLDESSGLPTIIDQTRLPFEFELRTLASLEDAAEAISAMRVRGAPLIGAAAAHGLALALALDPSDTGLAHAIRVLAATRPTAINLRWALARVERVVASLPAEARAARARAEAIAICDEDVGTCAAIGRHGAALLERMVAERRGRRLEILTHCNAGWLATVDRGTALAPIYEAHDRGIPVHVWVDETRPRNQGAALTAFELREHGVPHTVVADNAGGHLMQRGRVDLVLVGSDRTTAAGDVCNKIGTYLKALAARAHGVPFYVALPLSTIDWSISDGLHEIPIEERGADEVRVVSGRTADGRIERVELFSAESAAANPAFDVTPAALVTGLVTERGVVAATAEALAALKRGLSVG